MMARHNMAQEKMVNSSSVLNAVSRRNQLRQESTDAVFRAGVLLSSAMIVQAARDLSADCELHPGLTKYQIETRKQNQADRETARKWIAYPKTGDVSLSDCLSHVNQALEISGLPTISLADIRQTLLRSPDKIVALYPGASNRKNQVALVA